jgi:hypothetical protein
MNKLSHWRNRTNLLYFGIDLNWRWIAAGIRTDLLEIPIPKCESIFS